MTEKLTEHHQEHANIGQVRLSKHRQGWTVRSNDGVPMRLVFLYIDPPCYVFRVIPNDGKLGASPWQGVNAAEIFASPDTYYESLDKAIRVRTDEFWACTT